MLHTTLRKCRTNSFIIDRLDQYKPLQRFGWDRAIALEDLIPSWKLEETYCLFGYVLEPWDVAQAVASRYAKSVCLEILPRYEGKFPLREVVENWRYSHDISLELLRWMTYHQDRHIKITERAQRINYLRPDHPQIPRYLKTADLEWKWRSLVMCVYHGLKVAGPHPYYWEDLFTQGRYACPPEETGKRLLLEALRA